MSGIVIIERYFVHTIETLFYKIKMNMENIADNNI